MYGAERGVVCACLFDAETNAVIAGNPKESSATAKGVAMPCHCGSRCTNDKIQELWFEDPKKQQR